MLSRIVSSQGLDLDNSCCRVSRRETGNVAVTRNDGTPNIYDERFYRSIQNVINNNSDTNQIYLKITCSSIDVVALDSH